MSFTKSLFKNTSFNLLGYFYLFFASLISIPIIIHHLGTTKFALLTLITTLVNLSVLFNFGLHQATIRYLALHLKHKLKATQYLQTASTLILFLTLLLALTLFLTKPLILHQLHLPSSLFPLTFSLIILNFITSFLNTLPQARNDFLFYNLKTFLVGSTNTFLAAYLATQTSSLSILLLIRLLAQLLTLIFQLIYLFRYFVPTFPLFYPSIAQQLLSYSLKKFVNLISGQLTFHLPRLAITTYLPLTNLPLFTIPQGLVANLQAGLTQLTTAFFPLSTSLLAKNKLHKLKLFIWPIEILIFSGFLIFNLIVFLFGFPLLNFWLHNSSLAHQILPILKLLSLTSLISSLTAIPATILDALGKPEIPAKFSLLNLSLQIIFLYLFIPRFGLIGIPFALLAHNLIQVPLFLHRFIQEIN